MNSNPIGLACEMCSAERTDACKSTADADLPTPTPDSFDASVTAGWPDLCDSSDASVTVAPSDDWEVLAPGANEVEVKDVGAGSGDDGEEWVELDDEDSDSSSTC